MLLAWAALLASCGPASAPARSVDPSAPVVVPYPVAGDGEIRFTVQAKYPAGGPVAFDLDLRAGSQEIRGPLSGLVLASEMAGEQTIRHLTASELPGTTAAPGQRVHTTVTWDGRSDTGDVMESRTYAISLEFVVGGQTQRFGTVIEIRPR